MSGSARFRVLLLITTMLSGVGAIDAAVGAVWDLFALFVTMGALLIGSLALHRPDRHPVALRGDLVRWLRFRAQLSGESVETLADRAIAAYRADMTQDP